VDWPTPIRTSSSISGVGRSPTADERATWLRALGADEVALAVEVTEDETTWDRWCTGGVGGVRGVWVEAGWQSVHLLEASLQGTLRAERIDHAHLVLAEVMAHAHVLHTAGRFETWRAWLAHYPDEVQRRVTDATLARWDSPYTVVTRWSPVRRGQPLTLTEELVGDVHGVLRLLFALNREWEPDW
jgi:hypothetical protein